METTTEVGCVKAATAVLGDKWTPQLLRFFLSEETVRFCQLQTLVGGINPRTLSARLRALEEAGIVTKLEGSGRCDYRLTEKGRDLLPIIKGMEVWSQRYDVNISDMSQK
ncbi:MAG TPA: helix-turn-helix domain-containing protein [Candidatus Saccharimonadaceae bacterium]|nr:helix-turn-helix domain-containing protein [Candidatus Saccharimonadaceae bacterium]